MFALPIEISLVVFPTAKSHTQCVSSVGGAAWDEDCCGHWADGVYTPTVETDPGEMGGAWERGYR